MMERCTIFTFTFGIHICFRRTLLRLAIECRRCLSDGVDINNDNADVDPAMAYGLRIHGYWQVRVVVA